MLEGEEPLEANAYINWGRWLINCPHDGCNGGNLTPIENGETVIVCWDCGGRVLPKFPPPAQVNAAHQVLEKREYAENRNWDPTTQDVQDLKAENAMKGVEFA